MAGDIKVKVEKFPTKALNIQINKDIFYDFKVKCKQKGLPLNVVIEVFMNQYANGKYYLNHEKILKWKEDCGITETLNTTFNKEVYDRFKYTVKSNGYFVRHIVSAFIEDYIENDLIMEFTKNNNTRG